MCLSCAKSKGCGRFESLHAVQSGRVTASENLPKACSPLINTYWHQYAPFNTYACQKTGRKDAVAGCVIIALGQLINYHKIFNNGKTHRFGAINGYLNTPVDNFPKSEDKAYISDFIKDITANKHLSTYVEAGYAVYVYIDSISRFLESIGYNAYADEFDFGLVKRYLSQGNPVIIFAEDVEKHSHVWLIDGYKDHSEESILYEPLLHMNWGFGVKYQNGDYQSGWNRLSRPGFVTYRNVDFNRKTTVIYVSKK